MLVRDGWGLDLQMPPLVIAFSELQLYVCLVWLHHHQSLVPTYVGVGYMNVASSFGSIMSKTSDGLHVCLILILIINILVTHTVDLKCASYCRESEARFLILIWDSSVNPFTRI